MITTCPKCGVDLFIRYWSDMIPPEYSRTKLGVRCGACKKGFSVMVDRPVDQDVMVLKRAQKRLKRTANRFEEDTRDELSTNWGRVYSLGDSEVRELYSGRNFLHVTKEDEGYWD